MSDVSDMLWVERHRPKSLDDVFGNDEIISKMKEWAGEGDTPNVCFSGPSGTGKTAMTTAFARDLYGEDWRRNLLELNASDERGIDIVRNKIKTFAEQGTVGNYPYKLIFLDEADNLTKDSQSALRRVMEDYADKTRFILSCNYLSQLIDPIQSRCVVFTVSPLSGTDIVKILKRVSKKEGLDIGDSSLQMIADYSRGDARKAIYALQAASLNGEVQPGTVKNILTTVNEDDIEEIIRLSLGGKLDEAVHALQVKFLKEGVDSQTLASAFYLALKKAEMPPDSRVLAIHKLAEIEYRITQGSLPHIQWAAFLADLQCVQHLTFKEGKLRNIKNESA